jgi:hypothetical protein
VAAGPAAVIKQDNVTSIRQFGNEARRDRMTAPVAVVEVGEGQETADRIDTNIVSASAATSPRLRTSAWSPPWGAGALTAAPPDATNNGS